MFCSTLTCYKWDIKFPNYDVEYIPDIPMQPEFWQNLKDCLVVIDDLWKLAANSTVIGNVFKVYARKVKFSVYITSQFFFEKASESSVIRNNCDHFLLFENYSNQKINKSIVERLDLVRQYKEAAQYAYAKPYGYVLITLSRQINRAFAVCTNFFCEDPKNPYIQFFQ